MLARIETLERQLTQHCQTGHRQHQQNEDAERRPPRGWYALRPPAANETPIADTG